MEIVYRGYDLYEGEVVELIEPSYKELLDAYAKVRLMLSNKKKTEENIEAEKEQIENELMANNIDLEEYDDFKEKEDVIRDLIIWERY